MSRITRQTEKTETEAEPPSITIEIKLAKPSNSFSGGEVVKGKVLVKFPTKKSVRNIFVEIRGNSSVSWRNIYRNKSTRYTNSQVHFKYSNYFIGAEFSEENSKFEPGLYNYNFKYVLPPKVPSSYQGQHGGTKYIIEARITLPSEDPVFTRKEINIDPLVPLDDIPQAYDPILIEIADKSIPIRATAKAPCCGHMKKSTIPFKLSVQNRSKLIILEVFLRLQIVENYTASKPFWSTKSENAILEEISLGRVEPDTFRNITANMNVPDVIPSGSGYCSILDWEYLVTLVLRLDDDRELSGSCKIFIGTKKLSNFKTHEESDISQLYY